MFIEDNLNNKSNQVDSPEKFIGINGGNTEDVSIELNPRYNFYGFRAKEDNAQIHLIAQDIDTTQGIAIFRIYNSGSNTANVAAIRKSY